MYLRCLPDEFRVSHLTPPSGALFVFFFQAEDGIRDIGVTGVQTCALPISKSATFGASSLVKPASFASFSSAPADGVSPTSSASFLTRSQFDSTSMPPQLASRISAPARVDLTAT